MGKHLWSPHQILGDFSFLKIFSFLFVCIYVEDWAAVSADACRVYKMALSPPGTEATGDGKSLDMSVAN